MKYPKGLVMRANAILAERRSAAEEKQRRSLDRLWNEHPELMEARKNLNSLYAKRVSASFHGNTALEDINSQIHDAQEQVDGLMAAAGITEEDLEPPYACPICKDRGIANGRICVCRQSVLNQLVYEQLCDVSIVQQCSFDNFDLRYYDENQAVMKKVLVSCQRYVRDFCKENKSLLFTGATGLGKTHLSLAIAEGVVRAGWLVMYVSAQFLMDELERGKFKKDADALEFRDIIFGCDLLVIDDLGTELVTSYTKSEVYNLINTRLNTKRPTIINTNLTIKQIEQTYTSRISSRISGSFAVVDFKGRDIRLQKKYEGRF